MEYRGYAIRRENRKFVAEAGSVRFSTDTEKELFDKIDRHLTTIWYLSTLSVQVAESAKQSKEITEELTRLATAYGRIPDQRGGFSIVADVEEMEKAVVTAILHTNTAIASLLSVQALLQAVETTYSIN